MLIILALTSSINSFAFSGKVINVIDGDSIILQRENHEEMIRLRQIDAPEFKQPYGKKAKQALSNMILGKIVQIKGQKKDSYNRILGTVFFNDEDINLKMIREGHAWAYKRYVTDKEYNATEKQAQKDRKSVV